MSREAGPPGGWRAEWIASPARGPQAPDLAGCPWVWCREAAPGQAALFRTRLDLPHPRDVRAAWMAVGATGPFELFVNGQRAASGTYWSTAYRVRLLPYLVAGSNEVLLSTRPTGNPPALAVRISLTSSSGEQAATLGSAWDSAPAGADGRSGGWRPAAEVGRYGDREWGSLRLAGTPAPAPYLRRSFHLDRAPQRATAYATALGIYELRVNGEPVSDDLAPGWTDYGKRLQYQAYDVAPHLRRGENVLGLVLADGWYAGHVACVGREVHGGYPLHARLQLQLERPDR
ncbi:MAG TPA: alpha-L-rhamnosidase N-terminal domain-containing protein, partial [Deinococcales bacterium]|nr:alpha-L-rhamnosidase N-terminal domain-containing protein [Deinococcales bacterium]